MDDLLADIIKQRFNSVKAHDIFTANKMLLSFNYSLHLEHLNDLLGTEAIDSPDDSPTRILEIFEQSIYDVLVTMFIVPNTTEFNPLYELLTNMYKLENYLDHQVVLDEIDDMDYLNSPRDTLINLLEKLFGEDWEMLNENILEVRKTLITLLVQKHTTSIEVLTDEGHENLIRTRENANRRFFTMYPNTVIGQFVVNGMLPVPVETERALQTVTAAIYSIEDYHLLAIEMIALAFIAPVKLSSIPIQAKTIINLLYVDVNMVTQLSLEVDRLVREGGLTDE